MKASAFAGMLSCIPLLETRNLENMIQAIQLSQQYTPEQNLQAVGACFAELAKRDAPRVPQTAPTKRGPEPRNETETNTTASAHSPR